MTEVDSKDVANATAEASQHSGAVPWLPTELLPLILRNVSAPKKRTFYVCCLLSKQWHDAASPFLWSELAFGKDYKTPEQLSRILAVQSKTVLVRYLNLSGFTKYPYMEADLIRCISTGGFCGVRILDLEGYPSLSGEDLSAVFVQCPHLIALLVKVVDLDPSLGVLDETGVLQDGFSRLKLLKLRMASPGNCFLKLAAESVGTGLESVHFATQRFGEDPRYNWHPTNSSGEDPQYNRLLSLVGQRCPNLRDFSASWPSISSPTLTIPLLPFWDKLLRLSYLQHISDESLRLIARRCVSLKYLHLWWGASVLRVLADGPFLVELSLDGVTAIMADDFAYWLQRRGGSLMKFSAESYNPFTEEMLELLAQYAPNLEAVSVGQIDIQWGALGLLRNCAIAQISRLCASGIVQYINK
ncbi:hypothetical protein HK104_003563 [Borealophlyctis nickersoniae]|nr:hypothetical protein HK104_003563 [Borealophlyctis nickersoniae]